MDDNWCSENELMYFREKRLRIIRRNAPICVLRYFFERLLRRPNKAMPELIKVDKEIQFLA